MAEETKPDLASQYEQEDSSYNPAIDNVNGPPKGETPEPEKARGEDGRFLPASEPPRRGWDGKPLPSETPPQYKHSRRLAAMARDMGIPEDEIASTPTEQLDDTVYHLFRQRREMANRNQRTDPDAPATPAHQEPAEDHLDLPGAEDFDPRLTGFLKRQAAELKSLKAQLADTAQREQGRAQESMGDRIDRYFDEEKDEGRFGKGGRRSLTADSPEFLRRMAVLQAMDKMREGTEAQRFKKAMTLIYGSSKASSSKDPEDELEKRKRDWEEGAVAQPTHRNGAAEPKGVKRAVKTAAAFMRENGMAEDQEADPDMPD